MVSAGVTPSITESPTPVHIDFINYNLIPLNILFDAREDTTTPCYMDKILGVSLILVFYDLPCIVLLHSPVNVKLALNYPDFLQTKNVIWPRSY